MRPLAVGRLTLCTGCLSRLSMESGRASKLAWAGWGGQSVVVDFPGRGGGGGRLDFSGKPDF
jgi:hypothetical protein